MTFTIDTGHEPLFKGARAFVPDWAQDQCPESYTDAQVVQSYAHHVMGQINNPKKMDTVRKHILFDWAFIRALADESPGLFDEIWTAYAERAAQFD